MGLVSAADFADVIVRLRNALEDNDARMPRNRPQRHAQPRSPRRRTDKPRHVHGGVYRTAYSMDHERIAGVGRNGRRRVAASAPVSHVHRPRLPTVRRTAISGLYEPGNPAPIPRPLSIAAAAVSATGGVLGDSTTETYPTARQRRFSRRSPTRHRLAPRHPTTQNPTQRLLP